MRDAWLFQIWTRLQYGFLDKKQIETKCAKKHVFLSVGEYFSKREEWGLKLNLVCQGYSGTRKGKGKNEVCEGNIENPCDRLKSSNAPPVTTKIITQMCYAFVLTLQQVVSTP